VLRVGADNKIEYTPVKLGPLIDGLRVVREGLKADDVIVVKGLQQVRPGMPVTPQLVAMGPFQKDETRPGGNTVVARN
jgi:multidrug efflux system membrane fusion protein